MSSMRDAASRFTEGMKQLRAENFEAAIEEFTAAVTIDPDYVDAYRYRADAYGSLRMERQAKADLEKVDSIRRSFRQQR